MGTNIVIANKGLRIIKDFGYIEDIVVDKIVKKSQLSNFKCLKYLDKYDHTYFNSKQWDQLQKEIEVLESNNILPLEIIRALKECLLEVQYLKDYYFSFIGD